MNSRSRRNRPIVSRRLAANASRQDGKGALAWTIAALACAGLINIALHYLFAAPCFQAAMQRPSLIWRAPEQKGFPVRVDRGRMPSSVFLVASSVGLMEQCTFATPRTIA